MIGCLFFKVGHSLFLHPQHPCCPCQIGSVLPGHRMPLWSTLRPLSSSMSGKVAYGWWVLDLHWRDNWILTNKPPITDICGKKKSAIYSFVVLSDPGFHHGGLPVPGAGGIFRYYWSVHEVYWSSDNCTHHLAYWPFFVRLGWHERRKPLGNLSHVGANTVSSRNIILNTKDH